MNKIDELILKASTVSDKFKKEKGFKQAWFVREEMKNVVKLVLAEVLEMAEPMPSSGDIDDLAFESFCNEVREKFGVKR